MYSIYPESGYSSSYTVHLKGSGAVRLIDCGEEVPHAINALVECHPIPGRSASALCSTP